MPEYIVERHLPGNDYGEWGRTTAFHAEDDEDAKRVAMELFDGWERLTYRDAKIRIVRNVFEGPPSRTGYPYLENHEVDEMIRRQAAEREEALKEARAAAIDYSDETDLSFVLKTVPQGSRGHDSPGYHLRLLYGAGEGRMGSASEEEVEHAKNVAKLAPGDTTISVYWLRLGVHGGAFCTSVSKVVSFVEDEKTPKELIHLWPLELPNLALEAEKLHGVKVEDERAPKQ